MELHVITDERGRVIATARAGETGSANGGSTSFVPLPGPGQQAHVVRINKHLENITDADQLHRELEKQMQSQHAD